MRKRNKLINAVKLQYKKRYIMPHVIFQCSLGHTFNRRESTNSFLRSERSAGKKASLVGLKERKTSPVTPSKEMVLNEPKLSVLLEYITMHQTMPVMSLEVIMGLEKLLYLISST